MRRVTSIGAASVDPGLGLEPGDRDLLVAQARPVLAFIGEGVFEPLLVVPLREVLARVSAAALLSGQRAGDGDQGDVQQVAELLCFEQFRVEYGAAVGDGNLTFP